MNDDAFKLVRQTIESDAMTEDERQLERLRITCERELPPMRFLFRIFGKPCFPRGELVAVTGKAKSGKTLFNSMLMACCTATEVLQVQRPPRAEGSRSSRVQEFKGPTESEAEGDETLRCMWYDTEQSEQSTQDILKNRILPMARLPDGEESGCFDVFNVRCLNYTERLRLFKTAVMRCRPDLVVLDGVRDLMADINDGVKAQEVMEHLMRLAQEADCCMVCVLHQNKGAEDRNLRGWIGTELMNKAFEVYSCEKAKPENIFVVEQTHTRKYDLEALLFFRMDGDSGLPVVCEAPVSYTVMGRQLPVPAQPGMRWPPMNREYLDFDENNQPHPKKEELFYEALKAGPLYYSDLQAKVMELLNCGSSMWNMMFRDMRSKEVIVRTTNAKGKTMWTLAASQPTNGPETATEPDLFEQIEAELRSSALPLPP